MRLEFEDSYKDIFTEAFQILHKTMTVKLYAIEKCTSRLEEWMSRSSLFKGELRYDVKALEFNKLQKMTMENIKKAFEN